MKEIKTKKVRCALCGASEEEVVAEGYDYEYKTTARKFTYVRCKQCDLVYLSQRPTESELRTIYPPEYYAYSDIETTKGIVALLRERMEAKKVAQYKKLIGRGKKRILDVGCGDGRFMKVIRKYGYPEWEIEGFDINKRAIAKAKAEGMIVQQARLEEYTTKKKFDLIISLQVIEHLSNPLKAMKKMNGFLKEGGLCVIETPNLGGIDYFLFKKAFWGGYHIPRHWNIFNRKTADRLCKSSGFEVIERVCLISPAFWIDSFYNYLLCKRLPQPAVNFFYKKNPLLLSIAIAVDKALLLVRQETSNQRIIGRKKSG